MTGAGELARTLTVPGPLKSSLRQATITSVQTSTCTIRLGGGTTDVAGVAFLSNYLPVAGDTVWLFQSGPDLLIVGTTGLGTAWQSYNPTWFSSGGAPPTVGNGTLEGRWRLRGRTLDWRIFLNAGTTTNFAADTGAAWFFSPPFAHTPYLPGGVPVNGTVLYVDTGGGSYHGPCYVNNVGQMIFLVDRSTAGGALSFVTRLSPHGWGNGDQFSAWISYEISSIP
jgi:hypothetical protein